MKPWASYDVEGNMHEGREGGWNHGICTMPPIGKKSTTNNEIVRMPSNRKDCKYGVRST